MRQWDLRRHCESLQVFLEWSRYMRILQNYGINGRWVSRGSADHQFDLISSLISSGLIWSHLVSSHLISHLWVIIVRNVICSFGPFLQTIQVTNFKICTGIPMVSWRIYMWQPFWMSTFTVTPKYGEKLYIYMYIMEQSFEYLGEWGHKKPLVSYIRWYSEGVILDFNTTAEKMSILKFDCSKPLSVLTIFVIVRPNPERVFIKVMHSSKMLLYSLCHRQLHYCILAPIRSVMDSAHPPVWIRCHF